MLMCEYKPKFEKKAGVHLLPFGHKSSPPVREHSSSQVLRPTKFTFKNHLCIPLCHVEVYRNPGERNFQRQKCQSPCLGAEFSGHSHTCHSFSKELSLWRRNSDLSPINFSKNTKLVIPSEFPIN